MWNQIKRFIRDESGLETVEWALVGGAIVAAAAAIYLAIGQDVVRGLTALDAQTSNIP